MSFFNSKEKKNISDNNSDNDFLKPLPLHNKSSISNKSITPNNKNISLLNRIRNTEF